MQISRERKAIESTYTDTCTVYGFQKIKKGGATRNEKIILLNNIKCALSQKSLKPTAQSETANAVSYDAKLFTAPEMLIEPGSRIEVSRLGRVSEFVSAGEPFVYETHQEIMLKRSGKA